MVGLIDIEKMKGKIKRAAGWLTGDLTVGWRPRARWRPSEATRLIRTSWRKSKTRSGRTMAISAETPEVRRTIPPALSLIGEGEGGGLPGSDDAS